MNLRTTLGEEAGWCLLDKEMDGAGDDEQDGERAELLQEGRPRNVSWKLPSWVTERWVTEHGVILPFFAAEAQTNLNLNDSIF